MVSSPTGTDKAELALSKGREDLAKAALVERQKAADMADQLKAEIQVLDDALVRSEEDIASFRTSCARPRTKQNAIATRLESATNKARLREMWNGPKTHEAFSRFDLLERRVDEAEGRAEAMGLGSLPKTLDEEIAELKGGGEGRRELAAMKGSLSKEGLRWRASPY